MRKSMRRIGLLVPTLLAACSLIGPSRAEANFIGNFTGNTQPQHAITGVGGTINFAVYDTTGGGGTDPWNVGVNLSALFTHGQGSATNLDTTAKYLYLFQTNNNGMNSSTIGIGSNTVSIVSSSLTSFGSFAGTSFSTGVLGTAAGFGDQSTASTGATPTVLTGQLGLDVPTSFTLNPSSLVANYSPELGGGSTPTESVLWGYTSNYAPSFGVGGLLDGGTTADGTVPFANTVPEPGSVVLSAIGLSALGLVFSRRRRTGQS